MKKIILFAILAAEFAAAPVHARIELFHDETGKSVDCNTTCELSPNWAKMEDACRKACEEIKACQQACPPSTDRGAKSTSVPCALQCGRR